LKYGVKKKRQKRREKIASIDYEGVILSAGILEVAQTIS
jgi:hypothetical protein